MKSKGVLGLLAIVLALATVVLLRGVASAGSKNTNTVYINTVIKTSNGSLGSARNSANTVENINCSVNTLASGSPIATANCGSENAAGTFAFCQSTATSIVNAARSIGPDSYIEFDWDSNGNCTRLLVENGSTTPPKTL